MRSCVQDIEDLSRSCVRESEAPALDLDRRGSFASTEEQLLGEMRDALTDYDEDDRAAVKKAVEDATEAGYDAECCSVCLPGAHLR